MARRWLEDEEMREVIGGAIVALDVVVEVLILLLSTFHNFWGLRSLGCFNFVRTHASNGTTRASTRFLCMN